MKATELRIGNLVMAEGVIAQVDSIGTDFVSVNVDGQESKLYDTGSINGIPLTEERLVKRGFTKLWHLSRYEYVLYISELLNIECVSDYEKDGHNLKLKVRMVVSPDTYVGDEEPHSVNYLSILHIDFEHQLQNLSFALTGNELELK